MAILCFTNSLDANSQSILFIEEPAVFRPGRPFSRRASSCTYRKSVLLLFPHHLAGIHLLTLHVPMLLDVQVYSRPHSNIQDCIICHL